MAVATDLIAATFPTNGLSSHHTGSYEFHPNLDHRLCFLPSLRVAFDLDNPLMRYKYDFPLERPRRGTWAKRLGGAALRLGITELADYCRQRQWEVWVYTTSYRNSWYIRKLFWRHGIWLA